MIRQCINMFFLFVISVMLMAFVFGKTLKQGQKKTSAKKTNPPAQQVSFKKDIQPIFKKYCLPCHTEDEMNPSELYLDSYEHAVAGGKHGKPIVVGQADSSMIVRKLNMKPPFGDPMPMKRKTPFPQDTLELIKKWITQGAKNN